MDFSLSAPLQQIIFYYFVKVIEIEDQSVKYSFALILNILIGYVLLNGNKNIKKLYKKFKNKYFEAEDYIDLEDFDYSKKALEEVTNYTFESYLNHIMLKKLCDILKNKKKKYSRKSTVTLNYINSKFEGRVLAGMTENSKLCMPVYRYNKNEYVWVIGVFLYSNDLNALEKYYSIIYNHKIKINVAVTSNLGIIQSLNNDGRFIGGYKISPNKTFNKLFFREKENLINVLNKFSNGNLYPKNLGLDNKLGILLYGPPGTGKTGIITAIANHLKKGIVVCNSLSDLVSLMSYSSVYVLNELDYILNKPSEYEEKKDTSFKELKLRRKEKNDDGLNKLIKFLDGNSIPNRIIIATTNYPEKINPVFLRPGRFDLKLELSYCDSGMFENIIKTVYPDFIFDEDNHNKYINKDLAPSTLINSLAVTDTLEDCLEKL